MRLANLKNAVTAILGNPNPQAAISSTPLFIFDAFDGLISYFDLPNI